MQKRTKATSIPNEVILDVLDRDNSICVACGRIGQPNCHYIKRSQGGLGIVPWNITTLCPDCEWKFDHGSHDESWDHIEKSIKDNFKLHYPDWDNRPLKYEKGKEKSEDYV